MIDMHSHILPKMDDGSKSISETRQMLKEARAAGFTTIVSTTHYYRDRYECIESKRQKCIDSLKENMRTYCSRVEFMHWKRNLCGTKYCATT